ncbi:MAG TPA: transketolase C-terminal domain-containing protein, partial [Candidatus Acidoferrales bacterium]|nr:transketolase C-terminal domain-containing protein [Candidatus Acidoferrales bacterium]
EQTIIDSVKKTGRVVIVQEAARTGGFSGEIAARIAENAFGSLLAPVQRVTGYDIVLPLPRLEEHFLPNAARITAAAERALAYA